MATKKICDVTGDEMQANELDFGGNMNNQVQLGDKAEGIIVQFGFKKRGQFTGGDLHISREGAEKLLLEAASNLPAKNPATKVPAVQEEVAKPGAATTATTTEKPDDKDGGKKTGPTLNR